MTWRESGAILWWPMLVAAVGTALAMSALPPICRWLRKKAVGR